MKFTKKHERKLIRVRRKLEAAGWRFHFLGNPTLRQGGDMEYWMNASSPSPASTGGGQVSGWFTLAELKKGDFNGKR
jgi:hypothetical protein